MKKNTSERHVFVEQFALASLASVLADALDGCGITQRELADRLGVTEARVSQILAADSNPTLKSLARIADALGKELKVQLAEIEQSTGIHEPYRLAEIRWHVKPKPRDANYIARDQEVVAA